VSAYNQSVLAIVSTENRTVGVRPKIGRTFSPKMIKFSLELPNFSKISQKSASFERKIRLNFGRNSNVRVSAEIQQK
jgi:hypothetical protein